MMDYEEAGYSRVFFHDAGPTHELDAQGCNERIVMRRAQREQINHRLENLAHRAHELRKLDTRLSRAFATDAAQRAHIEAARVDIERFFDGDDVPAKRPRYPVIVLPWP